MGSSPIRRQEGLAAEGSEAAEGNKGRDTTSIEETQTLGDGLQGRRLDTVRPFPRNSGTKDLSASSAFSSVDDWLWGEVYSWLIWDMAMWPLYVTALSRLLSGRLVPSYEQGQTP